MDRDGEEFVLSLIRSFGSAPGRRMPTNTIGRFAEAHGRRGTALTAILWMGVGRGWLQPNANGGFQITQSGADMARQGALPSTERKG